MTAVEQKKSRRVGRKARTQNFYPGSPFHKGYVQSFPN